MCNMHMKWCGFINVYIGRQCFDNRLSSQPKIIKKIKEIYHVSHKIKHVNTLWVTHLHIYVYLVLGHYIYIDNINTTQIGRSYTDLKKKKKIPVHTTFHFIYQFPASNWFSVQIAGNGNHIQIPNIGQVNVEWLDLDLKSSVIFIL